MMAHSCNPSDEEEDEATLDHKTEQNSPAETTGSDSGALPAVAGRWQRATGKEASAAAAPPLQPAVLKSAKKLPSAQYYLFKVSDHPERRFLARGRHCLNSSVTTSISHQETRHPPGLLLLHLTSPPQPGHQTALAEGTLGVPQVMIQPLQREMSVSIDFRQGNPG